VSYNTLNYRAQGGSTWVVGGELNISGIVNYASGAYNTRTLTYHTTAESPLIIGGMNWSSTSTGITMALPTPVAGAEVMHFSGNGTSGKFVIRSASATTLLDIVIGTATEATLFADDNTHIASSGPLLLLKAINSSQWVAIINVGVNRCTTSTTDHTTA